MGKKLAILQPEIPHYRKAFFEELKRRCSVCDLYVYNTFDSARSNGFNFDTTGIRHIRTISFKGIVLYNPFALLNRKYDTLVLMWHFAHLTTWLLLLTKFLHRKRIILWGQGISVKRYLREERHPDLKLRWMLRLADGAWTYMPKEERQWKGVCPGKPIVALCNTLTGIEKMIDFVPQKSKAELKSKYQIKEPVILIYCARFTNPYRRTDLLLRAIETLDKHKYGFVIIGDGPLKPDFNNYSNVYDFGAIYDTAEKQDLFALADFYYQPGWVGLSIVEALAYGKPVLTFRRSEETKQCVEYSYIHNGENGLIFDDFDEMTAKLPTITDEMKQRMSREARRSIKDFTIENMASNAIKILR